MKWKLLCPLAKNKDLKMSTFESVNLIHKEHWNAVLEGENLLMGIPYLKALETTLSAEIIFRYLIFYDEKLKPVSIAVTQIIEVNSDSFNIADYVPSLPDSIKGTLLENKRIRILVCGNIFTCGENGFRYKDINDATAFENLSKGLYKLRQSEEEDSKITFVLLKDFFPGSVASSKRLEKMSFRPFEIDVNMVIKLDKNWKDFDTYLATMNSKFRTKAKSVLKKSEILEIRELDKEEISAKLDRIEDIYLNVVKNASFSFGLLPSTAFLEFKKELGSNFIFKGFFLDGELVGFSTAFVCGECLDSSYIGLDYERNITHSIYQRMLYDLVETGIRYRVTQIILGRTAEEIKSGIGALPVPMQLYLRHRNALTNQVLKPIIESISPSDFEIRKPFKTTQA